MDANNVRQRLEQVVVQCGFNLVTEKYHILLSVMKKLLKDVMNTEGDFTQMVLILLFW